MTGSPDDMTMITIRDINVISDPIQSVTIFDIFDHDKFVQTLLYLKNYKTL